MFVRSACRICRQQCLSHGLSQAPILVPARGLALAKPKKEKASKSTADGSAKKTKAALKKEGGTSPNASALSAALKQVEMAYGKNSIMQMGKSSPLTDVDVISTGSLALNHALGVGGLPKGRIVEIYGPEASGKTTVALHVVAECQKAGGNAVFVDAEHALDPVYSAAIGVDMEKLYVSQPDSGEQALDIVDTLVSSGAVGVVVVDSVAALVPRAELEGDMGDHHIALQARLMSQALRKLTATVARTKTCIIFINQIRQKVGVIFGNPEVTAGGMALRYYCSVRLEVRKGTQMKNKEGEAIGNLCKVKVAKNKLAPPFQSAEFDMLYGVGFDKLGEVLDMGVKVGAIKKSGSWYSVEENVTVPGFSGPIPLGQGKDKAKNYIEQQPKIKNVLVKLIKEGLSRGSISTSSPAKVTKSAKGLLDDSDSDDDEEEDELQVQVEGDAPLDTQDVSSGASDVNGVIIDEDVVDDGEKLERGI